LIGLSRTQVDFAAKQVTVIGKGNKHRIVPFGKQVAESMEHYLAVAQAEGLVINERFFVLKNGKSLYPNLVYRVINKYLSQVSSLKQRSPHVLRHTFATHLLDHGADLNAIKELLGHASLAATQVYTHNSIAKLKSVHEQAHPRAEQKVNRDKL
jgi:integrase/recombinase XerC